MTQITTKPQIKADPNHDSGYAPSNIEDINVVDSPNQATIFVNRNVHYSKPKNGAKNGSSPKKEPFRYVWMVFYFGLPSKIMSLWRVYYYLYEVS